MLEKNLLSLQIQSSIDRQKQSNLPRTMEVLYRGRTEQLFVIDIKPEFLILDHQNARIGAQLKDIPDSEQYMKNPEDQKSQDFIAKILRDTEGFEKLKQQLKETQQYKPGIISVYGRLIQGNTRAVALKELGKDMAVAVLPADATEQDFLTISMTWQMMELVENPFTATNLLLRINDHLRTFANRTMLIKDMGWQKGKKGENKLTQHLQWLALIDEMRKFAKPLTIPYSFFDLKKEHIKDLNNKYQLLLNEGDLSGADQMKYSRFTGMLLGIPKDQLRTIDDDFFENDLFTTPKFDFIKDCQPENISEELSSILGESSQVRIDSAKVFKKICQSFPEGNLSPDLDDELNILKDGIDRVTDDNVREESRAGIRKFPVKEIEDIRKKVEEVRTILPEARQDKAFELGKFKYALKKLSDEVEELTKETKGSE